MATIAESTASAAAALPVTIVTQTRVRPEAAAQFAGWQERMAALIATQRGFLEHKVLPPAPPEQVDWVIVQRFATTADAVAWMNSPERLARIGEIASYLVGNDDVHLVRDGQAGFAAPVSAVIATRIKPGMEDAYRKWERRIAVAQSKSPGFQGYRFEPPIPGVQEEFVAIVRFDTEAHLQTWMNSPERARLLEEGKPLTDEFHARIVRTGFEQWFPSGPGDAKPAVWKQDMLVLLMLYPVVAVFGLLVQAPILIGVLGLPFALALFLGNVASVVALNFLVPWVSTQFNDWLQANDQPTLTRGAAIIAALYVAMILVFWMIG
jgi:antibiotic biosynthesis monooxygenase (ABM) superfamily enzyme